MEVAASPVAAPAVAAAIAVTATAAAGAAAAAAHQNENQHDPKTAISAPATVAHTHHQVTSRFSKGKGRSASSLRLTYLMRGAAEG